jgi:hypothetical protein
MHCPAGTQAFSLTTSRSYIIKALRTNGKASWLFAESEFPSHLLYKFQEVSSQVTLLP